MGVHLHLAAISDSNISRLMTNPTLIWTLVFADQFNAERPQHWATTVTLCVGTRASAIA